MSECMTFPDTVEEFMDSYKIVDTEQVYTNGTEMVPIYRMRQWFEHEGGDYCMSRITFNEVHQKSLDTINKMISDMDAAGCQSEKINSNIITACLIEMNGYLAAIAESLIKEDEE